MKSKDKHLKEKQTNAKQSEEAIRNFNASFIRTLASIKVRIALCNITAEFCL